MGIKKKKQNKQKNSGHKQKASNFGQFITKIITNHPSNSGAIHHQNHYQIYQHNPNYTKIPDLSKSEINTPTKSTQHLKSNSEIKIQIKILTTPTSEIKIHNTKTHSNQTKYQILLIKNSE